METFNNQQPMGTPPDNHLVWAILCTIFCCLPLGIVSIIKSTKVKELWAMGDTAGAQRAADEAKKWAIWGAVAAVIVWVLYFVLFFFIGIGGALMDSGNY
ncbi:CD225/dispanin family protein [Aequorivita echinoideorum]|nr:CD225/dispanin family protein [Aequorivita echinoideorum]